MVSDYEALLILRAVDDKEQQIAIEPAAWLVSPEDT
jgi:hypothetical protein